MDVKESPASCGVFYALPTRTPAQDHVSWNSQSQSARQLGEKTGEIPVQVDFRLETDVSGHVGSFPRALGFCAD